MEGGGREGGGVFLGKRRRERVSERTFRRRTKKNERKKERRTLSPPLLYLSPPFSLTCTLPSIVISFMSLVPYALLLKVVSRILTRERWHRPKNGKSATLRATARSRRYGRSKLVVL